MNITANWWSKHRSSILFLWWNLPWALSDAPMKQFCFTQKVWSMFSVNSWGTALPMQDWSKWAPNNGIQQYRVTMPKKLESRSQLFLGACQMLHLFRGCFQKSRLGAWLYILLRLTLTTHSEAFWRWRIRLFLQAHTGSCDLQLNNAWYIRLICPSLLGLSQLLHTTNLQPATECCRAQNSAPSPDQGPDWQTQATALVCPVNHGFAWQRVNIAELSVSWWLLRAPARLRPGEP